MKRPEIGDTFTNGIDNITDEGEGQIKVHDGHINVGPVTEDALGVRVEATLIDDNRAELHTEEVIPPVEETGDVTDSFNRETHARIGKTFSAVIDEVTDEGHGLIYTRSGFINLGPVTPDAEGEYVHALKLPGNGARVKSSKVQPNNYINKLEKLFDYNFSLAFGEAGAELGKRDHKTTGIIGNYASISDVRANPSSSPGESDENQDANLDGISLGTLDIGDVFSAEVSHISSAGNGVIEAENSHINIGPVRDTIVGQTIEARFLGGYYAIPVDEDVRTGGHKEWIDNPQINLSELDEVPISVHSDAELGNNTAENVATREQPNGIDSEGEAVDQLNTDSGVTGESPNSEAIPETDLRGLREKAQADAVEEVPVDTTTSKSSKQEYSRSSAIREYVKARAGGVCEACGNPAPFKTPNGDPYLHAHHIHELSDGGSDTIDSVAAVCPNCHYRIHHGSDGDKYNQALLEKISKIENTV